METYRKQSCSFRGQTYLHDYRLCTEEKCMICQDGKWEDRGENTSGLI